MSQEDLDSYRVRVEEPIQGTYRGRNLYTTGPPSSGPVLLHMLNLVEQYGDFINDGRTGLNTHRIVEILKCRSLLSPSNLYINAVQLVSQQGNGINVRCDQLLTNVYRTNISDVTSSKDQERMDHIDSKEFAEAIFPNITDVPAIPFLNLNGLLTGCI
jgi:gamma-glutamyltranspeptidase